MTQAMKLTPTQIMMNQCGVQLHDHHERLRKAAALKVKLVDLWESQYIKCSKCGIPKKFGRTGDTKNIDNPARALYDEKLAAGTLTFDERRAPVPARFITIPHPNVGRFWHMCRKTKAEGDSCMGSWRPWDEEFGGMVGDPRFAMFRFMIGERDASFNLVGAKFNTLPTDEEYNAIMALPSNYIRDIIDPGYKFAESQTSQPSG